MLIIVFFSFFFVFLFIGQVIGLLSSIEIAIWKVAPLNDKYLLKALIYIVVALTIIRHFGRNFFWVNEGYIYNWRKGLLCHPYNNKLGLQVIRHLELGSLEET